MYANQRHIVQSTCLSLLHDNDSRSRPKRDLLELSLFGDNPSNESSHSCLRRSRSVLIIFVFLECSR